MDAFAERDLVLFFTGRHMLGPEGERQTERATAHVMDEKAGRLLGSFEAGSRLDAANRALEWLRRARAATAGGRDTARTRG